jgi:CTP:molybdopterin cytidylyltransferase MocA|tara:strand:+ start:671 stop:823 length:153 start_codon:yes stop_codon:yes gene_type:complete
MGQKIMISAILLAAGQSKRMSGENKLTKKIQDIPLIKHSVKNISLHIGEH